MRHSVEMCLGPTACARCVTPASVVDGESRYFGLLPDVDESHKGRSSA